nr:PHD finger protein 14 [Hymenolepis microstoma]
MAQESGSEDMFTRRNPSQRQIKRRQAEDLLLDDFEDESDDDYVFEGDVDEASDESGSESDESDESSESDSDSSVEIVGISHTSETVLVDSAPDGLIAVPSEAYPVSTKIDMPFKPKLPPRICMICLGDESNASDELIECDACKVVVHEECHKVYENVFLSSSASSSETDPWFCEPCLAGVENPMCELCPNLDGVFKRTDNNRWVHILCALYTRGVKFDYLDSLQDVTLTELPYQQWSSKECSLCQDKFFAWTGVCIDCDAGLCKSHFHATCAQREGLISEPLLEDSAVDPYFAHCKQHTEKEVIKVRRRNYLSAFNRCQMMRQMMIEEKQKNDPYAIDLVEDFTAVPSSSSNEVKSRFNLLDGRLKRKLEYFRDLYNRSLRNREKPYTRPTKVPFYMENSPLAMRAFVGKSLALNLPLQLTGSSALTEATKTLAPGCPVFCSDFVNYVLDREKKIDEFSKCLITLEKTRTTLQVLEAKVSSTYNALSTKLSDVNVKRNYLRDNARSVLSHLASLLPGLQATGELAAFVNPPKVTTTVVINDSCEMSADSNPDGAGDAVTTTSTTMKTPRGRKVRSSAVNANVAVLAATRSSLHSRKRPRKDQPGSSCTSASKRPKRTNAGDSDVIVLSEEDNHQHVVPTEEATVIHVENILHHCSICGEQRDQHLLAICDTCKHAFHIACLDPPLARVPKPSKLFAWQCSACTLAVVTPNETVTVDINAPRQLRRNNPATANSSSQASSRATPLKNSSSTAQGNTSSPITTNLVTPSLAKSHSGSGVKRRLANASITTTRYRGGTRRGRSGRRPRVVKAEAYDPVERPQEVIPSEAYPVTEMKPGTGRPISISSVDYEDAEEHEIESYGDSENNSEMKPSAIKSEKTEEDNDDLSEVRSSRVKFVRIKGHESPNQGFSEQHEQQPPQHYVICASQETTPKKSPSGNFKIKIKKSTNS